MHRRAYLLSAAASAGCLDVLGGPKCDGVTVETLMLPVGAVPAGWTRRPAHRVRRRLHDDETSPVLVGARVLDSVSRAGERFGSVRARGSTPRPGRHSRTSRSGRSRRRTSPTPSSATRTRSASSRPPVPSSGGSSLTSTVHGSTAGNCTTTGRTSSAARKTPPPGRTRRIDRSQASGVRSTTVPS